MSSICTASALPASSQRTTEARARCSMPSRSLVVVTESLQ